MITNPFQKAAIDILLRVAIAAPIFYWVPAPYLGFSLLSYTGISYWHAHYKKSRAHSTPTPDNPPKHPVVYPENEEALIDCLQKAQRSNTKISVQGARYGHADHRRPPDLKGSVIDLKFFNKIGPIQREKNGSKEKYFVWVEAGCIWTDLSKKLNEQGFALCNVQGSNIFTVGGSISCNAHGAAPSSMSCLVRALRVLMPDGRIRTLSRNKKQDRSLMSAIIGGFGAIAIIIEAEIEVEKNRVLTCTEALYDSLAKKHSPPVHIIHFFHTFRKKRKNFRAMRVYLNIDPTDPHFLQGGYVQALSSPGKHRRNRQVNHPIPILPIAAHYQEMEENGEVSVISDNLTEESLDFSQKKATLWGWILKKSFEWGVIDSLWPFKIEHMRKNPSGIWRGYTTTNSFHDDRESMVLKGFPKSTLQEVFIPEEKITSFIERAATIFKKYSGVKSDIHFMNVVLRRVPPQDNVMLSYAPPPASHQKSSGWRWAYLCCIAYKDEPLTLERVAEMMKEFIDCAINEFEGIPYLCYGWVSPEQFEKSYQRSKEFMSYQNNSSSLASAFMDKMQSSKPPSGSSSRAVSPGDSSNSSQKATILGKALYELSPPPALAIINRSPPLKGSSPPLSVSDRAPNLPDGTLSI